MGMAEVLRVGVWEDGRVSGEWSELERCDMLILREGSLMCFWGFNKRKLIKINMSLCDHVHHKNDDQGNI